MGLFDKLLRKENAQGDESAKATHEPGHLSIKVDRDAGAKIHLEANLPEGVALDSCQAEGTLLEAPGTREPPGLICPSCGCLNSSTAKFCQDCGKPLRDGTEPAPGPSHASFATATVDGPASSRAGITIEFPYSTAGSFEAAVECASRFPTFRQTGQDKKAVYRVSFEPHELDNAMELVDLLKGWRRRAVYVDGEKTLWDSVFSFARCYEQRKASYKPEFYCFGYENDWQFNLWGCVNTGMPFVENTEWFCWGRWVNKSGDWEFDKGRIRHELEQALYHCRFCPTLDLLRAEDVLRALPDRVNPTKSSDWQFVEAWEPGAEGLTIVTESYGFKKKSVMKGVSPKGKKAAYDIAQRLKLRLPA